MLHTHLENQREICQWEHRVEVRLVDTSSPRGRTGPDDGDLGHRAHNDMPHQLRCFGVASSEEESILVAARASRVIVLALRYHYEVSWLPKGRRPVHFILHLARASKLLQSRIKSFDI
jgi:hypothetical protein